MNILVSLSLLALCSVAVCGQVSSYRDSPGHYGTEYGDGHQDKREATDVADDRSAEAQPEAWGGYGHGLLGGYGYGLGYGGLGYGYGLGGYGRYGLAYGHHIWKRSAGEQKISVVAKRSADPKAWGGYGLGLGYGGLYGLYGHGLYGHGLYGHGLHSFWKRSAEENELSGFVKRSADPIAWGGYGLGLGYGYGGLYGLYGHGFYGHGLYGHDLHSFWKRSTDHRKMSKVVKRSAHPGYG